MSYWTPSSGITLLSLRPTGYARGLSHPLYPCMDLDGPSASRRSSGGLPNYTMPNNSGIRSVFCRSHHSSSLVHHGTLAKRRRHYSSTCTRTYRKTVACPVGQTFDVCPFSIPHPASTSAIPPLRVRASLTNIINTIFKPEIILPALCAPSRTACDFQDETITTPSLSFPRLIQLSVWKRDVVG